MCEMELYCVKLKATQQSWVSFSQVWRTVDMEESDPNVTNFLSFSREARSSYLIFNMKSAGI